MLITNVSFPSLVLVQPRKTRPFITERLLMGRKESNQTKWNNYNLSFHKKLWKKCEIRNNLNTLFNLGWGSMLQTWALGNVSCWITITLEFVQLHYNYNYWCYIHSVKGSVTQTYNNMGVFPFIFPHKQKLTKREKWSEIPYTYLLFMISRVYY